MTNKIFGWDVWDETSARQASNVNRERYGMIAYCV